MITKAEIRQAAIDAGIPADDVDKLLGPGLALPSIDQRLTLRLVIDDGDLFSDVDSFERRGWSTWAREEHARGAFGDGR